MKRKSDRYYVDNLYKEKELSVNELEILWKEILKSAPLPPNGGRFAFWSNFKCPKCKYEFPYNYNDKNIFSRIFENHFVVVDGTLLIGDTEEDTYMVGILLK